MDLSPLWISCKIAFTATLITFALGILCAWAVGMTRRARPFLDAVLSLPLVLPPTVVGFFLLLLFSKNGGVGNFLFKFGINPLFTWGGGVFAATVVSFPVMYRTARGAFGQIDPSIIAAARTLGLGEFWIFTRVMIPVSLPGIAAAVVFSFARALGEFGATIMVAGNLPGKTQTMAVAVYTAMQGGNKTLALKWVLIIFALSAVTLLLMNLATERAAGRGGAR